MKQSIRVLLIEDNPGHTRLICKYFDKVKPTAFSLICAECLSSGLKYINNEDIDVVLLDINLPDSRGIDTFTSIHDMKPEMPIVVVTSHNDDIFAMKAMQEGAQDYIVKEEMSSQLLLRSMRYAIERQRLMSELRLMSLVDELTGLYNRRGFRTLAEQNLKIVDRLYKNRVFLFFSDVDNLKKINDTHGHKSGDRALKDVARLLKKTFRNSDIIARLGGDEFAVLAIGDVNTDEKLISDRFYCNLDKYNNKKKKRFEKLSLSIGIARYNPDSPLSLDGLLTEADSMMYKRKRGKK